MRDARRRMRDKLTIKKEDRVTTFAKATASQAGRRGKPEEFRRKKKAKPSSDV